MKGITIQIISLLACSVLLSGLSDGKKDKKEDEKQWDVSNPPGAYKEVEFTLEEGTWMNLDVSPDGQWIVFDLLGDIYKMPVNGGEATLLRGGHAFEVQPRFSPDGSKISFTSDAGGGDNIWVMNTDGSGARAVTNEDFRLLNNAVWTPDGQYLVARKHFTSRRSLGAGEMWLYHIAGGEGLQLTKRKNDQQDVNEPCVSPDGRYVYFSEDMYPGGYFQYNKDPNKQIYMIRRYDRKKGVIENIVTGPGGAVRPQLSPDGNTLAFVKRVRAKSVLYIRDLNTGEQKPVFDGLSKDQQEAWAIFGVYTGFNWLPDNRNIIIWGKGKIHKVDTQTGASTVIPFKVHCKHRIYDALKFRSAAAPDRFEVKMIRQAVTSPDGKLLVFNAVGHLWKKPLPDGECKRLTKDSDFEFEPSFSPDQKSLVYVTWNDENYGSVRKLDMITGKSVILTREKGIYREPSFSPDGQKIVFRKESGNYHQGFTYCEHPGLYWMSANGGEMHFICRQGSKPKFTADGKAVYFSGKEKKEQETIHALKRINLDGYDLKTVFTSKYSNEIVPSPNREWVLFRELFKVYVAAMPQTGKTIALSSNTKAIPVAQVARDAGNNLHWSSNHTIHWTLGETYFTDELSDHFSFLAGAPDSLPPMDTSGIRIGLQLPGDKPKGTIVLKNARIISMKNQRVIERGTIIVKDNRILAIQPGDSPLMKIPDNALVMDLSGKTIIPGLIDVHAHLGTFRLGLSPQKQWSYYANLAYGITTTHDPSSNTEMVFSQSEMVKAGYMVGPRIFSTGTILYGAEGDFKAVVNSLEDARSHIRRMKAVGAFTVKSYNQPRREQRQQIITAAREQQLMVYPEGGSFFFHNMSMILDGHTGIEHNIPVAELYDDVIQLWSHSNTGYTPTLIVCYGAINGEYYYYQHDEVWKNERLLRFTPRQIIDSRSRHVTKVPEDEYQSGFIRVAQSCKRLADAGVKINVGGHGQLQGLGFHWELWMLVQGGMSNMEALKAATYNGAAYIGKEKELGSLETGKLADLVVLDKNPLDDIHNTQTVHYVMVNGRLYNAETMNEIGTRKKERTRFYWELNPYSADFPWHENSEQIIYDAAQCPGCY